MIVSNIGYMLTEGFSTVHEASIVGESRGRVIAEGIIQTADEKNRNGRFYPHEELFPQLTAPRTVELLEKGYLRAELGHPLDKELVRQQTIDGKLCCAKFLKLWTQGSDVWAQFRGTNNAYGDEFDADLRDGDLPAWSLRALGSIVNTSRGAEVRNLKVITWDQVIYPSHPGAYTKGIVSESAILSNVAASVPSEQTLESVVVPITNDAVINYIKSESANLKYMKENFDFMYQNINVSPDKSNVTLTDNCGNIFVVNLETYIHNDLMRYCSELDGFRY